jgi:nicotinamidase-related amidase
MTAAQSAGAIARVPDLISTARYAGMMVIHVVVAFRPGHPEVSRAEGERNAGGQERRRHDPSGRGRTRGEPIVVKHRISPFVGTDLETLLRANDIDTLVLAGVHASGAWCCRPSGRPAIWIIG